MKTKYFANTVTYQQKFGDFLEEKTIVVLITRGKPLTCFAETKNILLKTRPYTDMEVISVSSRPAEIVSWR